MLQKIIILCIASVDLFLLHILHYYVDEFCTNVKLINYLLMILKIFEPFFGKLSCSLILRPFQACTLFSYTSNIISTRIPISFTLNMIIRFLTLMFLALNPLLLFTISKFLKLITFIGPLITAFMLIKLAKKVGQNYQKDIQQAIFASILPGIIYIYLFITNSSSIGKLSILLPIIQIVLTDKGSLITSLLVGIFMINQSSVLCYVIQYSLIIYKLFYEEKNKYIHIIIGILISSATEMMNNQILSFAYLIMYTGTFLYERYKVKKL